MSSVSHSIRASSLSILLLLAQTVSAQYWLGLYNHIGKVAFQPDPAYKPYRNVVTDFQCDNTGKTDATACINKAIQFPFNANGVSSRCGGGDPTNGSYCQSSTITPALVYFPPGTYRVSSELVMWYATQMVGDATNPPTILVDPSYKNIIGTAVLDANIYVGYYDEEWYANQNNFYRQIRNFVIDMTQAPLTTWGIHWQVAQATSIQNVHIKMRPKSDTSPDGKTANTQVGIRMENGSGGFMADVYIDGGAVGAFLGSQQFTVRNMQVSNSGTAVQMVFDWVWLFTGLQITDCDVGVDMTSGGFSSGAVGSMVIVDSSISATQGILTPYAPGYSSPQSAGSLMLENVDFTGSPQAIAAAGGTSSRVILNGGQNIALFAQGNAWTTAAQSLDGQAFNGTTCSVGNYSQQGITAQEITIQRQLSPIERPASLVDNNGRWYTKSKPQYEKYGVGQVLSALANGLKGDGITDDTAAMQNFLNAAAANGNIAYFDHGAYMVSGTINVPNNIKIVGELYSIIMGYDNGNKYFSDQTQPRPLWLVGDGGTGNVEIQDIIWETRGPTPGMIVVQWNIAATSQGSTGIWDSHWRIGATAGTDLQQDRCLKNPNVTVVAGTQSVTDCTATFMLFHVMPQANGYFENIWGWVSDHELDMGTRDQVTIFNGRGFLIEGDGPNWLYGTSAEHSVLYNYQWNNARNTFAGVIQTETAYFQGNPDALVPFKPQPAYADPTFKSCTQANCARTWGARFVNSSDIFIYGTGLYNFFDNYNTPVCLGTESCQQHMVNIENCTNIYLWALNTKGSSYMVDVEGYDLLNWNVNKAGFCATAILFELADER